MSYTGQVREFMLVYNQPAPTTPTMPTPELLYGRHQMLVEESLEIAEATTRAHLLDGIVDALYVTYGTAVAAGFTESTIKQAFDEVHRSNMTKLWPDSIVDTRPTNTTATRTCGGWIVKNRAGKVIKPPTYSPPNLSQFCR